MTRIRNRSKDPLLSNKRKAFERRCEICGWILFIVSALFFISTSLRSKDILGLFGGIFFLVACFVFLIPYVFKK